ncbi:MAG: CHAT domain-containing protein [Haliscomenobacteraceae bacterium CHB4]|nr:hypothetical protein [Saprospiraceae bacterium]MCE7924492.1 CHAT domain-containing protein [Haliscomenobacteraceae bacterium CHB4]
MKTFLFSLFFCAPLWVAAQTLDSVVLKHMDSTRNVAFSHARNGDFARALEVSDAAIKFTTEKTGRQSVIYGDCCHTRGVLLYLKGDYTESEKWFIEAVSVLEQTLGKESLGYTKSLNMLANLNCETGKYEQAEILYIEIKNIREKILGKNNANYALVTNNLALLYYDMGKYEQAEPLYIEAESIWSKTIGMAHPDYAANRINLALLYKTMCEYEKAEQLYLEAKDIFEVRLNDRKHPFYMNCLNNLAALYNEVNQDEKAESLYLEAKNIRADLLGKEHPHYVGSLINLASLYAKARQDEKAELLFLEGKEIFEERIHNREHPYYITCLANLGILYMDTGQLEKAGPLLLQAKDIQEKVMGTQHPEYAKKLYDLAGFYLKSGMDEKAGQFLIELAGLNRFLMTRATHHLSERELYNYLSKFSNAQNLTLSYAQLTGGKDLTPACYDNNLFYKGFLLNAASRLNVLAESSPEARHINNQLKSYQRRLAAQYAIPITERKNVAELEEQANVAEKELARTVAGYAEAVRQVSWKDVQAALEPGEAAIEFVRFNYSNPVPTDSVLYAAFVLRPGLSAPLYISLFGEKGLAALLQQGAEKQAEHINALYRNPALYAMLWQPLEQALSGAKTVYLSPDGLLHRLNLRAVATPDGHILADRYRLIRLNSTRQLVIPPSAQAAANDALVYGGIRYDMDAGAIQKANASLQQFNSGGTRGELDFHNADSTLRLGYRGPGEGGAWNYLPFTEVEAGLLQHDLQEAGTSVRMLSGYVATEESFKSVGHPSPRILHFATHGFFFPDPKNTVDGRRLTMDEQETVFKISEHPMIRSGLLLAGANHAWKSGKPAQPGMEDGILTAYEISQMDLSNTELAVLSACETGLGDIAGSEGVYGLQRAFKIAGTHYLLMSLWKIPDLETQQLMTTFYRHWLKDGQSVPDAFQATQKEMRGKYKDPFLWAGFILVE